MHKIRRALPLLLALLASCRDGTGSGGGPPASSDREAPVVELTYPVSAGRTSARMFVLGKATDAVAVTRATFQVNGGPELPATLVTGSPAPVAGTVSFDATVTLPSGTHSVVAHAYDAAGNRGTSAAVAFQVDANAPQIQLQMPASLTVQADTLRVRALVTDDYNLGYIQIGLGTGLGGSYTAANKGTVRQYAVDTLVSLALGANEIRLTATDSVGNETRATVLATRTPATAPARFDAIFSYNRHGCGLRSGAAFCWGDGNTGALGDGRLLSRDAPVPVAGGLTFATLATAGWGQTCGLAPDGTAYCWGADFLGALGRGATTASMLPTPQRVATDVRFAAIAARTSGYNVCALSLAGEAYCWGANSSGQAGVPRNTASCAFNGSTVPCVPAPVRVQGGLRFASISVGDNTACGVTPEGRAYCWGSTGIAGTLGNGELYTSYDSPVPVSGGLVFKTVSVGDGMACGVTTAGEAYCWGNNRGGALGDGTVDDKSVPARVASNVRFRSVGVLAQANPIGGGACAQAEDGAMYCWGAGRTTPERLAGGLAFTRLSPDHGCGLTADRTAYCWTLTTAPAPVRGEYP